MIRCAASARVMTRSIASPWSVFGPAGRGLVGPAATRVVSIIRAQSGGFGGNEIDCRRGRGSPTNPRPAGPASAARGEANGEQDGDEAGGDDGEGGSGGLGPEGLGGALPHGDGER